jgi:hypothetical protein
MPEKSIRDNQLDWACRLLMSADMIIIISGYLFWFKAKNQLVTPLIPRSTIYEIFSDVGDIYFKISIIASIIFLAGLWFYSFKRKISAIIFFTATIVLFLLKNLFIRM